MSEPNEVRREMLRYTSPKDGSKWTITKPGPPYPQWKWIGDDYDGDDRWGFCPTVEECINSIEEWIEENGSEEPQDD